MLAAWLELPKEAQMKTIRHTPRLILGLVLGLATLAILAGSAAAARPAGMSPDAYQALMLRSQALNELYQAPVAGGPTADSLRADRLRGEELNRLYGNAATRMTPSEFKALYARGTWLNEQARTLWPASTPATAVPTVVTVPEGFDWGDAAIGAAFVAGLALLGAAATVAVRRRGRLLHLPR
jgi:hypothetical protein